MTKRQSRSEKAASARKDATKAHSKHIKDVGKMVCNILPKNAKQKCKEVFKEAGEEIKQDD